MPCPDAEWQIGAHRGTALLAESRPADYRCFLPITDIRGSAFLPTNAAAMGALQTHKLLGLP